MYYQVRYIFHHEKYKQYQVLVFKTRILGQKHNGFQYHFTCVKNKTGTAFTKVSLGLAFMSPPAFLVLCPKDCTGMLPLCLSDLQESLKLF